MWGAVRSTWWSIGSAWWSVRSAWGASSEATRRGALAFFAEQDLSDLVQQLLVDVQTFGGLATDWNVLEATAAATTTGEASGAAEAANIAGRSTAGIAAAAGVTATATTTSVRVSTRRGPVVVVTGWRFSHGNRSQCKGQKHGKGVHYT